MKHRSLVFAVGAAVIATVCLVCYFRNHQTAAPAASAGMDKAEQTRLANIARQKKDGIIPPALKKNFVRTKEEQAATRNASPTRDTSLAFLDLGHAPTEAELVKAGQLREPLSPTAPADPAKMSDPAAKTRQEEDNRLFGQAMNAWNQNKLVEALPLFLKHLETYPDSPWTAETRLHLGIASLQQGYYTGCHSQIDLILQAAAKGTDVYQKALLLKARALVLEQRTEEAAKTYSEAMSTETDARRRTTAAAWLLALSQQKKKQS